MDNSHRILIVDDDEWVATSMRMGLVSKGYQVTVRNSSLEAKEFLKRENFDLIILDMGMPDIDGLCFLEWLRQEACIMTPVLVSTSFPPTIKPKAIASGATDILFKPFTLPSLIAKVVPLLER